MKKTRPLLILTAFVSSILGGVVVYLMLSVPHDLRADALLKQARQDMRDGDNEKARQSLSKVVQQYPRTDAAAAATVALVSIGQKERDDLARAIALLRRQNEQQTQILNTLQQNVTELRNAPPKTITVVQPAPQPAAPKAAPKKNTTPKKTTTKRSTRRSR